MYENEYAEGTRHLFCFDTRSPLPIDSGSTGLGTLPFRSFRGLLYLINYPHYSNSALTRSSQLVDSAPGLSEHPLAYARCQVSCLLVCWSFPSAMLCSFPERDHPQEPTTAKYGKLDGPAPVLGGCPRAGFPRRGSFTKSRSVGFSP